MAAWCGRWVACVFVCRGEKCEPEWRRNDTAGAWSGLKLHCRRRGGLWGEQGGKAAAGEFLGQGAHRCERNCRQRKAKQQQQQKRVWVEPGRTGEQQKVARASESGSLFFPLLLVRRARQQMTPWALGTSRCIVGWAGPILLWQSESNLVPSLLPPPLSDAEQTNEKQYWREEGVAVAQPWALCSDHFFLILFLLNQLLLGWAEFKKCCCYLDLNGTWSEAFVI